jgi:sigma-B regulation protein RsbU (phosphoserine phosphatase)
MALSAEIKYRLLLELSQKISRTLDLQEVLEELLRTLRSAIGYDAAGVFVLNRTVPLGPAADGNLIAGMVQVGFETPRADDPMLRSGRGIIGHVIRSGEVVNAPDVRLDPHYVTGRSATRSELACPVVSEAGVIGCLNVESDRLDAFSGADAELLQFFADAAALSIQKALLHRQVLEKLRIEDQLRVARDVQAGLLPAAPPDLPGWDIAGINLPSWAIGGDYFDYLPLQDGRLGLVVADVSGKGIPAALIMATFRSALRTELGRQPEIHLVAEQLNRTLLEPREASRFVTAVFGVLDPRSGAFRYVNCGHNPPLVVRRSGGREMLLRGGLTLGLLPGEPFETGETCIELGDALVLYTDGVVEPADDRDADFGLDGLERVVREHLRRPAAETLGAVVEATRTFSGREHYEDDFTLVVARRVDGRTL